MPKRQGSREHCNYARNSYTRKTDDFCSAVTPFMVDQAKGGLPLPSTPTMMSEANESGCERSDQSCKYRKAEACAPQWSLTTPVRLEVQAHMQRMPADHHNRVRPGARRDEGRTPIANQRSRSKNSRCLIHVHVVRRRGRSCLGCRFGRRRLLRPLGCSRPCGVHLRRSSRSRLRLRRRRLRGFHDRLARVD